MKLRFINLGIALAILVLFQNCKKKKEEQKPASTEDFTSQLLADYSNYVVLNNYIQLETQSGKLHTDIVAFVAAPSQSLLDQCRTDWKAARKTWEESESHLFGPVSTNSIDPKIDTWPVDFNRLDSVLNSSAIFDQTYINNLEESLKGFHPIEYILFGRGGTKQYTQITARQKEYLVALSDNLKTLTASVRNEWEVQGGDYFSEFSYAGNGSTIYLSKRSAFEEMVNAMAGICDEVGNGKIGDVASTLDSTKEESPFAKNSLTDFTNNIQGVMNCYLSKNATNDGVGLEDFVKQYNLSLDGNIKQKHAAAITALQNITVPFGVAIFTQPIQVQKAVDAIAALQSELEDNLLPLIKLQIK